MSINTAIIPVAGWGTRRLPITKAIEKCMLPIGNRPIVDYVVEDCIKAGINHIIFVVSEQSEQIRNYYSNNSALNDYLEKAGKTGLLDQLKLPEGVGFEFVVQPQNGKYGTAIPVALAASQYNVENGAVVLMGDDFIYHADEKSEVARLLEKAGDRSSLLGVEVSQNEVSRYGVLELDQDNNFRSIVEKPEVSNAPSNLINVSKYVMDSELLKCVTDYANDNSVEGEYYITEPINNYVSSGGAVKVVKAEGEYLDGGSLDGWLHANNVVCG